MTSIAARVPVLTADAARQLDARTIARMPESFALMSRAGTVAADWLHAHAWRSAALYVGAGNNGGDGWVLAGLLRQRGWRVTVHEALAPRTPDALRAKADAELDGRFAPPVGDESIVLDALLGTGAAGAPRDPIAAALDALRAQHASADAVIAIDMPSALNATTGEDGGAVPATHTLTFGSAKPGQLVRRDLTGALHVLDIGLLAAADDAPRMVTAEAVRAWLPSIAPDAYKGTRKRLAIVGGGAGMAGAAIIAARGAHAAGIGMVRADVAPESALALQVAVPFATVHAVRRAEWHTIDMAWPDAMVIGPGLDGTARELREQVLRLLQVYRGPVVLDAGALTAFRARPLVDEEQIDDAGDGPVGDLTRLRGALHGRAALLTPHLGEFTALFALLPAANVAAGGASATSQRFDDPLRLAQALDATILLKGVPTVIASRDGQRFVSATGNPALAMGGTGDLLAGIAGTLLAQGHSALLAGAMAAWVHGRAAEQAAAQHGGWRGVTMDLLLHEVSNVWPRLFAQSHTSTQPHTLLELPAVPSR